jgi:hypothetical protein
MKPFYRLVQLHVKVFCGIHQNVCRLAVLHSLISVHNRTENYYKETTTNLKDVVGQQTVYVANRNDNCICCKHDGSDHIEFKERLYFVFEWVAHQVCLFQVDPLYLQLFCQAFNVVSCCPVLDDNPPDDEKKEELVDADDELFKVQPFISS